MTAIAMDLSEEMCKNYRTDRITNKKMKRRIGTGKKRALERTDRKRLKAMQ